MSALQTYTRSHVERQQTAHARADGYGRHRHLYLHGTLQRVAQDLRSAAGGSGTLAWLDYGCGKGNFIGEVKSLALFDTMTGYDPAVHAYRQRPAGTFDAVTCLDVLDIVEPRFLDAVLDDIAQLTAGFAVIDCLTRPKPGGALRPHPPFFWAHLVKRHMNVVNTTVEFPGMTGFERVIITANRAAG
jgi:hypothetical protein